MCGCGCGWGVIGVGGVAMTRLNEPAPKKEKRFFSIERYCSFLNGRQNG